MLHSTNMDQIDLQAFNASLQEDTYRPELITHEQLFWVAKQFNFFSLFVFASGSPVHTQESFETILVKKKKNNTQYLSENNENMIIPIDTKEEKGIEFRLEIGEYKDRLCFVSLEELRVKVQEYLK